VQLDFSLLTDLNGLVQKHPYLYPLPALPWVLHYLKLEKLKSYVRNIGDLYVESCRTVERCIKSTQHLRSSINLKTKLRPDGRAILSGRYQRQGDQVERREHCQGSTG
jgi:hypothetical protein